MNEADVDRMTFEEWFKREYPLFEREGRGTTLKHQLHAAWEARQALDRDAVFVPLDLKMLALRAEQGELLNEFAGAEGYVEYDLRTKENGYVATVQDYHTAVFITYLWNWFRSLKREPSAAPGSCCSQPLPCGAENCTHPKLTPAPAAHDVVLALKVLRDREEPYQNIPKEVAETCGQAAALLARLGQGWVPPTEQEEAKAMRDILVRQQKRNKLGASDE